MLSNWVKAYPPWSTHVIKMGKTRRKHESMNLWNTGNYTIMIMCMCECVCLCMHVSLCGYAPVWSWTWRELSHIVFHFLQVSVCLIYHFAKTQDVCERFSTVTILHSPCITKHMPFALTCQTGAWDKNKMIEAKQPRGTFIDWNMPQKLKQYFMVSILWWIQQAMPKGS